MYTAIFLGIIKFGREQKYWGENCPQMAPVATGLLSTLLFESSNQVYHHV